MEREVVKKNMDKMLFVIMRYLRAAGMNEKEFYELTSEAACTLITSTIDIEQPTIDCLNQYMDKIQDVIQVGCGGIIRAKEKGDYEFL
ncbi:MAG: hypothetical protein J6S85_15805 [Methanobrevibacter sp.]|nr:hypothetical protein [Methanobrevibacter sp.]